MHAIASSWSLTENSSNSESKVAWEAYTKTDMVMVFGEFITQANIDHKYPRMNTSIDRA